MKRLGIVSEVRLKVCGHPRTHICLLEEFDFMTLQWKHFKNKAEMLEVERLEIEKIKQQMKETRNAREAAAKTVD